MFFLIILLSQPVSVFITVSERSRIVFVYSLDSHSRHRLQVAVPRGSEVVLVSAHVHGVQPLSHGVKGREGGERPVC